MSEPVLNRLVLVRINVRGVVTRLPKLGAVLMSAGRPPELVVVHWRSSSVIRKLNGVVSSNAPFLPWTRM